MPELVEVPIDGFALTSNVNAIARPSSIEFPGSIEALLIVHGSLLAIFIVCGEDVGVLLRVDHSPENIVASYEPKGPIPMKRGLDFLRGYGKLSLLYPHPPPPNQQMPFCSQGLCNDCADPMTHNPQDKQICHWKICVEQGPQESGP